MILLNQFKHEVMLVRWQMAKRWPTLSKVNINCYGTHKKSRKQERRRRLEISWVYIFRMKVGILLFLLWGRWKFPQIEFLNSSAFSYQNQTQYVHFFCFALPWSGSFLIMRFMSVLVLHCPRCPRWWRYWLLINNLMVRVRSITESHNHGNW